VLAKLRQRRSWIPIKTVSRLEEDVNSKIVDAGKNTRFKPGQSGNPTGCLGSAGNGEMTLSVNEDSGCDCSVNRLADRPPND